VTGAGPAVKVKAAGGRNTADSEVDLLIDLSKAKAIHSARVEHELDQKLSARVELIPGDRLKAGGRRPVTAVPQQDQNSSKGTVLSIIYARAIPAM
jgi:hypothetical protein